MYSHGVLYLIQYNNNRITLLFKLNQIKSNKLKGIYPEFQVIRGLSQKIPDDLLSYDTIQS